MKRLLIASVICLAGTAMTAPSLAADPPVCTLIGCESGVGLEIQKAKDTVKSGTLCVQGRCRRVLIKRNRPSYGRMLVECSEEIDVPVTLTTRDRDGRRLGRYSTLVHLETNQPNGPTCGPTCFNGIVRFVGNRLVAVPPPAG
jgi:hypothetical protein